MILVIWVVDCSSTRQLHIRILLHWYELNDSVIHHGWLGVSNAGVTVYEPSSATQSTILYPTSIAAQPIIGITAGITAVIIQQRIISTTPLSICGVCSGTVGTSRS